MEQYEKLTDEQLIEKLHSGDRDVTDYLMEKYKMMVRKKARAMYLIGGETEDLIQEGMIGLYKAIRDYDVEKETVFRSFASVCIDRQLYNAVKGANRLKNSPLNTYISLDIPVEARGNEENGAATLGEMLEWVGVSNPEDILIDRERVGKIEQYIRQNLSEFEQKVVNLYVDGMNYQQIAKELGKTPKSIDNALQRIRIKIREQLEQYQK